MAVKKRCDFLLQCGAAFKGVDKAKIHLWKKRLTKSFLQSLNVPVIRDRAAHKNIQHRFKNTLPHGKNLVVYGFAVQNLLALLIDNLTLPVHHIIIFQNIFAVVKILALHFFLGVFNSLCQHFTGDSLALLEINGLAQLFNPLISEYPQQRVLQRQIKTGLSRVALTA